MKKETSILTIKLAKPAQRALANTGIKTLEQLSKYSEEEIAGLHGLGPNAVKAIIQSLQDVGMSFAEKKR